MTDWNTEHYEFQDGDEVSFDTGDVKGKGIVVGVGINEQPVIGVMYLLKVTESEPPIPNRFYPFSVLPMFRCLITDPPIKN